MPPCLVRIILRLDIHTPVLFTLLLTLTFLLLPLHLHHGLRLTSVIYSLSFPARHYKLRSLALPSFILRIHLLDYTMNRSAALLHSFVLHLLAAPEFYCWDTG
jgi:hypothetical protein